MSNRSFNFLLVLLAAIGGGLAFCLSSIPKLEMFKILNIVGIVYGLVGVMVLSEFVIQNEKWRLFVVEKLSGVLIWAHGAIPLGASATTLGLFVFARDQFPSALPVGASFVGFMFYSLVPTFFIEDLVFVPKNPRHKDPVLRTRIFGLFLVVTGMVVQLIAAVQDVLATKA